MTRYRYRSSAPKPTNRIRSWLFRLALVGLVSLLGVQQFRSLLPSHIQSQIQSRLNESLSQLGLRGSIRAVEFMEGKGFRINDLRVENLATAQGGSANPLFEIYEGFVHAPATMANLVTGHVDVKAIEIRGAKLTITRSQTGEWDFQELIRRWQANQTTWQPEIALRFLESEIRIIDKSQTPEFVASIRDITLNIDPVVHQQKKLLQFTGSFSGAAISRVDFTAYLDPAGKTWFTDIRADQAKLSRDIFKLFPISLSSSFDDLQFLDGIVMLHGSADGDLIGKHPVRFRLQGEVRNLSVDDRRLPLPLRDCTIDFGITQNQLEISRATGHVGQGSFDISYHQPDLFSLDRWSAAGKLDQFPFSDKLYDWMPPSCRGFCRDFKPRGTSNIVFQMTQSADRLTRNIQSEITNMSFEFYKFPYLLKNCAGRVSLIDEDCEFEVESVDGSKRVQISGAAKNPGVNATYVIDVATNSDFPIDDQLIAALEPNPTVKKHVLAFRPLGHISGRGRFVKNRPDMAAPLKSIDIQLHNCTVRHRYFDYPIGSVNGLIRVRGIDCEFENVTGANGTARIRCDGSWNRTAGLDLRFLCSQVPLDENLRAALNPDIREIWNGFRPRGSVGLMKVDLQCLPNQPACDVTIEADLAAVSDQNELSQPAFDASNSISIYPEWFPYEIGQLTGKVEIGHGRVTLTDIKGLHRRTSVACQGDGVYSNESWSVSLKNLLVVSLKVDDELHTALPPSLAPAIEQLEFQGLLNVSGEMTLGGRLANRAASAPSQIGLVSFNSPGADPMSANSPLEATTQLLWDLRFDMNQSQMQLGLPVENVCGMIQLRGQYDGRTASCDGEINVDSLTLMGAQITNLRGPIWIDEQGVAAGTLASKHDGHAEPRQLVGNAFNGQVRFDGQRWADERGRFYFQASITDGNLKEIVSEFAPHLEQVDGRCFGAVRMSGEYSGVHTYRGEGTLRLRDAEIYELPVILSLVKILRVKEVNRTAFDTSDVDFTINNGSIDLNRIELIGDAFSLIGNGKVDFNHQIDLNFYSIMGRGRWYIPVVSELYRAGSQQVLWINVDGTCDEPKTHRNVLPQLNDTIRSLLEPPPSRAMSAPGWGPAEMPLGTPGNRPPYR